MAAQRLPIPGSDDDTWGDILNSFLEVEHDAQGNLKIRTDGTLSTVATSGSYTDLSNKPTVAVLDSTASDIQPLGPQAAGSNSLAARADHVHAMPRLDQVSAPTASVALNSQKITGLATGTNTTDAATTTQAFSSSWINVLDPAYGAKADGTTDDTAAIQAAINACPAGGTVFFPGTGSSYLISSTLVVPSDVTLEARNPAAGTATKIQAAAGSNLDAMIASSAWYNNLASGSNAGITLRGLQLYPNRSNQTSGLGYGIAIAGWRCNIENCIVGGTVADRATVGLLITSTGRDGATTITGTMPENRVTNSHIYGTSYCVRLLGTNVTDAFITDNVFIGDGASAVAVSLNSGAGSTVRGNHIYSCAKGIATSNIGAFRFTDNYLEIPSAAINSGAVHHIHINVTNGGVIVAGNHVRLPSAVDTGNTYTGIYIQVVSSGVEAVIANNTIDGGTQSTDTLIQVIAGGGTGIVSMSGNALQPANGTLSFVNSSPGSVSVDNGQQFPSTALPTTATQGFAKLPGSSGAPSGTPADIHSGVPTLVDVTNGRIWMYNPSSSKWFGTATTVAAGTATLAAGTVTVANTSITANSILRLTNTKASGTVGALSVTLTASTSFTINSTSSTDTSKIFYEIVSY